MTKDTSFICHTSLTTNCVCVHSRSLPFCQLLPVGPGYLCYPAEETNAQEICNAHQDHGPDLRSEKYFIFSFSALLLLPINLKWKNTRRSTIPCLPCLLNLPVVPEAPLHPANKAEKLGIPLVCGRYLLLVSNIVCWSVLTGGPGIPTGPWIPLYPRGP